MLLTADVLPMIAPPTRMDLRVEVACRWDRGRVPESLCVCVCEGGGMQLGCVSGQPYQQHCHAVCPLQLLMYCWCDDAVLLL